MHPGDVVKLWLNHLAVERGRSANTLSNYRRDAQRYVDWLAQAGRRDLGEIRVRAWVTGLFHRHARSWWMLLAVTPVQ